jgi:hypothetical protein
MMQLTPAQIAVRLICGEELPPFAGPPVSLEGRLRQGRELFVQMTGKDFGFDLQFWHDHLRVSREGGYTFGRNIALPRIMRKAIESPKWRKAVAALSLSAGPNLVADDANLAE